MLTDKECRAATLETGKSKLFDGHGLYLELLKTGAKSWRWKYRLPGGKEKRLTFGLYPTISLRAARVEREKAAALLRDGIDPALAKTIAPPDIEEPTFKQVALDWHATQVPVFAPRHAAHVLRTLKNDAFPAIGALPISQVSTLKIVTLLKSIEARGSADVAHRMRTRIRDIFSYAVASAIVPTNPATDLGKALGRVRKGRFPAMETVETARAMLKAIEARPMYPLTRVASRLMALTAVRSGVLRLAEVQEFEDLDGAEPIWRIPASKMKLGQEQRDDSAYEFIVPLSRQAVEAVKVAMEFTGTKGLIFRSIRSAKKPISDNTISKLYRDSGYSGVHLPHGWRSTFSTVMNRIAAEQDREGDREVIELMLAHINGSVEAIYNRYRYMPRRRAIAQEWADMLTKGLMPAEKLVEGPRHP